MIFTAVTDPAAAELDSGNITGTSDALPVEAQLQLIRAMQPDAKTIGIIYTTSEPNSVSTIAEYQEKAAENTASPSRPWASPPSPRSPRPRTP